jgi:PhoPQ-activated pathogenicity-related protein
LGAAGCVLLLFLFGSRPALGESTATASQPLVTPLNQEATALDHYIAAADPTYAWRTVSEQTSAEGTVYVIELTSQTWLTPEEVDRPVWKHWLTVVRPRGATARTALMFVGGGSNGGGPPRGPESQLVQVALATRSVVAELKNVPNQPLIFHGDGVPRKEDDLIAYTWDHFLKTGDERWPARLPMVKSVVRAMDAVQELFAKDGDPEHQIDRFVVAGGSKRGWTTWMTAAVDPRVCAIVPIVIDVLNVDVSMRHHYSAYGFWAPAIGDYVRHRIMDRRDLPRYADLIRLEDPFAYRDRLEMPKCVINAAGDQFFCPDSSQFYFSDLPGEKHLSYVPNGDHSLDGTKALETLIAFHYAVVHDIPRPTCSWEYNDTDDSLTVKCSQPPQRVTLWQATNPSARDFRVDTIGRAYQGRELAANGEGWYQARLEAPEDGWTASFIQCEFDIGAPVPLRLSTNVKVLPEQLPFADKEIPTTQAP